MTGFIILFCFFFKAGCIHRRDKVALATEFVCFLSVTMPVATQYIGSVKTQPVVQCVCVNTLAQCGYAEVDSSGNHHDNKQPDRPATYCSSLI